jgi:UV DNA damage endonuclease
MTNLGYADKNYHLSEKGIRAGRGMQKKTFRDKGLEYVGELAEQNCRDLKKIVKWNSEHEIYFYRITSSFIPWHNRYQLQDLTNYNKIKQLLSEVGELADENNQRLTFHPGHFVKLASPTEDVAEKAIDELNSHGKFLDLIGAERSTYNSINIHIGAHYSDKEETGKRFCENYRKLSESAKSRLTVENDDKESLWSVSELIEAVHDRIYIPVVYDRLHHRFSGRTLSHRQAAEAAADTWNNKPIMHYSESEQEHGNEDARPQSHSDKIEGPVKTYDTGSDVMVEAKDKEKALLEYRDG